MIYVQLPRRYENNSCSLKVTFIYHLSVNVDSLNKAMDLCKFVVPLVPDT